jgi:5-methylcytosine-specific restriction protein A
MMNRKPQRVCVIVGCTELASVGRCPKHLVMYWRRRVAQDRARPTAAQRGYSYGWQQTRLRILSLYGYRCMWPIQPPCPVTATDVDHRIPRNRGGSDEDQNLVPLCHAHHSEKTGREGRIPR